MAEIIADLPQPTGPTTANIWPRSSDISKLFKAFVPFFFHWYETVTLSPSTSVVVTIVVNIFELSRLESLIEMVAEGAVYVISVLTLTLWFNVPLLFPEPPWISGAVIPPYLKYKLGLPDDCTQI